MHDNRAPAAGLTTARLERLGAAVVWVLLLVLALHKIHAYDIWWQIATGEWILANGLPRVDPFSYAFPGREWIEPRWIFCITAHLLHRALGLDGLILAKLVLLAGAFAALSCTGPRGVRWAAQAGMLVALIGAHGRFMVRPELVSFAALMLTLLCVERFRRGGGVGWIYALPALQLVWCNAHTLWILGPAVLWIVVLAEWLQGRVARRASWAAATSTLRGERLRSLWLVAAVTSAVSLLNPYGLRGVLFPFRLLQEIGSGHFLSESISEFVGPLSARALEQGYRTTTLLIALVAATCGFVLNRRRVPWSRAALGVAFLLVALEAQRNVALFALVAGFTLSANLGEWWRASPRTAAVPRAVLAGVIVVGLAGIPWVATDRLYRAVGSQKRFGLGLSPHKFPVRAMAFLREAGLGGRVLHALGDGGYVLFDRGEQSVFADGRLEVYDEPILRRAMGLPSWGPEITNDARELGVTSVVLPNEPAYGPLLGRLLSSPDWSLVYFDHLHQVLLAVTPATAEAAARLRIDPAQPVERRPRVPAGLEPRDWPGGWWPRVPDARESERLGSFFVGVGNYDEALRRFERAVEQDPSDDRAGLFCGLFYRALGRTAEGEALLRRVPDRFWQRRDVLTLAGEIHMWARNPGPAVEFFGDALRAGAADPAGSTRVARAALAAGRHDVARATLDRLMREHPDHVDGWNLLGALALEQGRPSEAARYFDRSLALRPDQPRVRALLDDGAAAE